MTNAEPDEPALGKPRTDSPEPDNKTDLVTKARRQLASASEDFQQGLAKVKNPTERRKLAASYVDLMQTYLGKAQLSLARYRTKLQPPDDAEPPA
jgi:hypothetical protein